MTVDETSVRLDPELAAVYLTLADRRGGPRAVERTALRTRSRSARDLLSYAASPGHLGADALVRAVREARAAGSAASPPELDLEWTLALARTIGMQNLDERDPGDAVLLLQELRRQHGTAMFTPTVQQTVVERLWQAGEHGLLRAWLPHLRQLRPDVQRYLRADLTNPFSMRPGLRRRIAARRWQRLVDKIFTEHGIEPIRVVEGQDTPFDGLRCDVDDPVTDGPLVTVIMPVYRPGPELVTSVRSICEQTWRNLEVLIMDDASPAGHEEVLDACAALDARVQVHRMDRNGGTYLARNAALDIASGELVTVQDADDWSHPRRIELQAKVLLADPGIPATRSYCLRVSEDLVLQRPGYETSQENASSFMFRREQALATAGYFDRSRKSADTEFRRRLELATGALTTDLRVPLAVVRMAGGSLSRADFVPGWHHPSRYIYRAAYERWHARLTSGADPYLPRFQQERRFAVPQRFQIDQESLAVRPPHYDVVLLGDWRHLGPAQRAMLGQVRALVGAGYRVGLTHRESYQDLSPRRQPLHPEVLDLVNEAAADFVALDQVSSVSLLVVRPPELLQFAPAEPSTLQVDRVVVVADRPPHALDGTDRRYSPAVCDATVRTTFSAEPLWVPQTAGIRRMLTDEIPSDRLAAVGGVDVVEVSDGRPAGEGRRSDRPVLGRRVADPPSSSAWPASREEVLAVYPVDGSVQVRVLGDLDAVTQVLGEERRPEGWVSYRNSEIDVAELVDQIDVYVHHPHPRTVETLDPDVARAVAGGCVAVLPPRFEGVFGEAALYAEPADVPDVVRSLHDDPVAYREQSDRGTATLRARFGRDAYLAEVRGLIGPPRARDEDRAGLEPPGTTPAAPAAVPRPRRSTAVHGRPPRDLRVILTATAGSVPRLGETLQRMRDDGLLFGTPVTVVYAADARVAVRDPALQHPGVRFVEAEGTGRTQLAEAACAELATTEATFVTVADVPRGGDLRSWSRALHRELDRLRTVDLRAPLPVLVWTRRCNQQTVSAYLSMALRTAAPAPGPFLEHLAGLCLRSSAPRVEALDPSDGQVEVSVWLAARLSPDLPRPPWRYRLVLVRGREATAPVASPPVGLTQRVDNRGNLVWEDLRARIPLEDAGEGNHVFTIEVDTEVEALRTRRRLRPSKGVLLSARTVTMASPTDPGAVVRYLVHAGGARAATYLTTRVGRGASGRVRWSAGLVRKDVGALLRRRGGRQMIALRLARLVTRPFFVGRQIWLVGERTDTAQDNGLHLFRHLRVTDPRRDVYYVIDPASPQRGRVAPLGNVVDHSSLRHQLLMLHADVLANAYSTRYLTPSSWSQESYVQHLAWRIGALRVYLKHGVHLNPNAVKRGISGYDMFLTVMPRESEAIRAVSGYDRQIREIGMPRYDGLVPAPSTRTVLFMPTWRQYLVPRLSGRPNPGQIPFEGSAYEQFVSGFLQSPRLHDLLERHDFRLTFLPHYNMASSFDRSVRSSDRISLADTDVTSFQDLLRGCDAFITDYSSVHFDVAYLGTPVIYARFDEADYEAGHASRSWFDYETDGYGPVVRTLEETLDALEVVLDRGCTMEEVYAARVAGSFTYRDRDNCARTVAAIDELSAARRRGPGPTGHDPEAPDPAPEAPAVTDPAHGGPGGRAPGRSTPVPGHMEP